MAEKSPQDLLTEVLAKADAFKDAIASAMADAIEKKEARRGDLDPIPVAGRALTYLALAFEELQTATWAAYPAAPYTGKWFSAINKSDPEHEIGIEFNIREDQIADLKAKGWEIS